PWFVEVTRHHPRMGQLAVERIGPRMVWADYHAAFGFPGFVADTGASMATDVGKSPYLSISAAGHNDGVAVVLEHNVFAWIRNRTRVAHAMPVPRQYPTDVQLVNLG